MNNLKQIRTIYGITQDELAKAINVNRVTVANWESGNSVASNSSLEKMSLYYGIGPEFFYEKELSEKVIQMLVSSASKSKKVTESTNGSRIKEDDFGKAFSSITFEKALSRYMYSMKMLLATSDSGELDKLKTAALINKKMGERLEAIIKLREEEINKGDMTLFELMESIDSDT